MSETNLNPGHIGAASGALASGAGAGTPDAKSIVDGYRTNGSLDTERLAKAIYEQAGGDPDKVQAFKAALASELGPLERGEVDRALDRQDGIGFGEHVVDGIVQFGKGVWGMVSGLGSLAWSGAKTAYDTNLSGLAVDAIEARTGADLPDWLPSAERGAGRLEAGKDAIVGMGTAIWDDPSILLNEYKPLAADGRYGAIVGQLAADFGDLLIGAKGAGKAGQLGRAAGAADSVADAAKVARVADGAADLARAAVADPAFAASARPAMQATRAALEGVEGASDARHILEDVLEISAPRDPNIGNPAAIARGFADLSGRQVRMLDALPAKGSAITLHKSDVVMTDIAALTAKTGDEFAIFTRGSQRMVVRGDATSVPIDVVTARGMAADGWRWSAHTQPGMETVHTIASTGDQAVLEAFGQTESLIMNSRGQANVFSATETLGRQP